MSEIEISVSCQDVYYLTSVASGSTGVGLAVSVRWNQAGVDLESAMRALQSAVEAQMPDDVQSSIAHARIEVSDLPSEGGSDE